MHCSMASQDPIQITDPEGIVLLLAVALIYLGIRLMPRFLVGFRNFVPALEVKRRLDAGDDLLLVDVRSRGEFVGELGHLSGAVNVPLPELRVRLRQDAAFVGEGEKTVVTICRSDARAAFAVRMFRHAGFRRVLVMSGGMLAWLADDLPVERGGK